MTDLLLCAKERSRSAARRLASALGMLRIEVTVAIDGEPEWDAPALDAAARNAKAVVALWSNDCFPHGGDVSGFVRRAAAVGRKRGTLVSTLAEPTAFDPPWNEKPALALLNWAQARGDRVEARREWLSLLSDLGAVLRRPGLSAYAAAQESGDDAALRAFAKQHPKDPLAGDVWNKAQAQKQLGAEMISTRNHGPAPAEAPELARAGPRARSALPALRAAALGAVGLVALGALGYAASFLDQGPPAANAAGAAAGDQAADSQGGVDFGFVTVVNVWQDWTGRLGAFGGGGSSAGDGAETQQASGEAPADTVTVMHGDIGRPAAPQGPAGAPATLNDDEVAAILAAQDARQTPVRERAPIVADPARLPDLALFRECEACPDMVVIPAGTFLMGSPAAEAHRGEDEDSVVGPGGAPVRVTVPRFAIARFETSWNEWNACVAAGACDASLVNEAGADNGWGAGRRPLIEVNGATDPQAYAAFVSAQAGGPYRLPTEAEWEYAARAGSQTAFPWGDAIDRTHGNYGDEECCSGGVGGADSWLNTAPVGSFPANPWGLFDMHGNVMEWVADCYRGGYARQPANAVAFTTPSCSARVLRGGSWDTVPEELRSAFRMRLNPERRFNFTGFRLARTL